VELKMSMHTQAMPSVSDENHRSNSDICAA